MLVLEKMEKIQIKGIETFSLPRFLVSKNNQAKHKIKNKATHTNKAFYQAN
jgi:hypothetical protein